MTKSERQEISIKKFREAKGIGAFDYVMRFGKTTTALKIARKFNISNNTDIILSIVPNVGVKKVWKDELIEFNHNFNQLLVVMTLDEVNNTDAILSCGFLIIDEIHKYTSEERLKIIRGEKVKSKFRLGLTGTYPYDNETINKYFPVIDVITEKEALANNWISNFIEYNIPLQLSMQEKQEYMEYSMIIHKILQMFKGLHRLILVRGEPIFNNDLSIILACYRGDTIKGVRVESKHVRDVVSSTMGWNYNLDLDNQYDKQIDDNWNVDAIKNNARRFYVAMEARNKIHNESVIKLEAVLQIYDKFKDNHFIIFNETTNFADIINDSINTRYPNMSMVYHSNIKGTPLLNFFTKDYFRTAKGDIKKFGKKLVLDYINEYFKANIFNCISTVKALDEGISIENINIVICTSGTTNPVTYSQRSARGKTIDRYNKDKITLIFNLYFEDFIGYSEEGEELTFKSRDKYKMVSRQSGKLVKSISMSDLLNYVKINVK